MSLENKVAIITGGAHGIGAAIARVFVARGAKVLIGDILDDEGTAVASELNAGNKEARAHYMHFDVTRQADWAEAIRMTEKLFGRLTTLVNNAGVPSRAGVVDTTEEQWDRTIDTDLKGTWLGMKMCIPAIKRSGGGAIVNTSSNYALVASGRAAAYHSAKAGVLSLSRAAAVEYARENIRVNAVLPGVTDTPRIATLPPDWKQELLDRTPLNRLAHPDEVAKAFAYLASDDASYVTGTALVVDGGFTAM
jgi:NAD(P)-dependent dehydrogenase (short-subunit alcohol dehydrogenase family)